MRPFSLGDFCRPRVYSAKSASGLRSRHGSMGLIQKGRVRSEMGLARESQQITFSVRVRPFPSLKCIFIPERFCETRASCVSHATSRRELGWLRSADGPLLVSLDRWQKALPHCRDLIPTREFFFVFADDEYFYPYVNSMGITEVRR